MSCHQIDVEAVELYVMGRLPEGAAKEHLASCPECADRIMEARRRVDLLRVAFKRLQSED